MAADFAPGVIGIRDVDLPDWKPSNTQGGIKLEGVYKSVGFSLNYYHFYQQLPVLRGDIESMNPFTGEVADWDHLIAFDIGFPEVDLFGGSLDFYVDSIKSVFRVEATYHHRRGIRQLPGAGTCTPSPICSAGCWAGTATPSSPS